jgi:hypothetical protein
MATSKTLTKFASSDGMPNEARSTEITQTRKSQLGSDPFAPLLAYRNTALAFGVRP